MKKTTLLVAALFAVASTFGQSWSDNFESYTAGDFLGVAGASAGWGTWSGTPGGSDDVLISNADAASGSNSIYIDGQVGGGPNDVVLTFPELFESGLFHLDFNIKADSGFYINLQGALPIGSIWALDFLADENTFYPTRYDGTNNDFYGQYDISGTGSDWHNISVDVNLDLTSDNWVVKWDGQEVAAFTNTNGDAIGALNFFPLDAEQDFYIDDVNWSHTPSQMVTFKVDMSYYLGAFNIPEVNGTYNGWCGACNVLSDGDGDGVWEGTFMVTADTIEYKFAYDNWTGEESLTEGSSCTKTTDGFTNRFLVLDGNDVELDVVCWEQCIECAEPAGLNSLKGAAGVTVYPNPATDLLTIEFGEEASEMTIAIVDVMGRTVMPTMNQFSGNRTEISVNELPQGAYFITGTSEGYSFKKSIMIAK